jgi:hypothetical protein
MMLALSQITPKREKITAAVRSIALRFASEREIIWTLPPLTASVAVATLGAFPICQPNNKTIQRRNGFSGPIAQTVGRERRFSPHSTEHAFLLNGPRLKSGLRIPLDYLDGDVFGIDIASLRVNVERLAQDRFSRRDTDTRPTEYRSINALASSI